MLVCEASELLSQLSVSVCMGVHVHSQKCVLFVLTCVLGQIHVPVLHMPGFTGCAY